jgi:UDP-GlcNAc:undecaprenyl-phosphate/decaprenyl-phosphate GlcNAc-1-phosphate transferase
VEVVELIMTLLVVTNITAFFITLFLTLVVKKVAFKYNICAKPNHRSIHQKCIPLMGGVAIFGAFLLSFSIIWIFSGPGLSHLIREIFVFLIGGLLILLIGIYDDIKGAHWLEKFAVQFLAGSIVVLFGYKISVIVYPFGGSIALGFFSVPITLLWIVFITNALNLIDGLDGLAAGISFIAACLMLFISLWFGNIASAFPAAILAGSLLAFLIFNFNPAKIFLGDSGSLFLGFMLACFSINGTFRDSTGVAMLIPIIVLGIPITDTILAFIRRLRKGAHPFVADREHIHHRLLTLGMTHKQAVLSINFISLLWGCIAVVILISKNPSSLFLILLILATMFWGIIKMGFVQYFLIRNKNERPES